MEEEKKVFKKLSELLGKGVQVNENPKSLKKKEEKQFVDLIETLCQVEAHSAVLRAVGVDVSKFQEPSLIAFDSLLMSKYGDVKASIIMWWIFESTNEDGTVSSLIDEDGNEYVINTPLQLYKFLKRYDNE
jgi:hypothetical protein